MSLEYISLNSFKERGYDRKAIENFDCGEEKFNTFLTEHMDAWEKKHAGITYFLVDTEDENNLFPRILAYATVSTAGLLNASVEEKKEYISSLEIKLFAIHKAYRGQKDKDGVKYSHIFFAILIQDLWEVCMKQLSFKTIFIQANDLGKSLYSEFGFVEIEGYIAPTVDDKLDYDGCIPMICEVSDDLMYAAFE